jgi:hypothetical protein
MLTRGPRRTSRPASPHTFVLPRTVKRSPLARGRGDRFDSPHRIPSASSSLLATGGGNRFPHHFQRKAEERRDFPKRHAFELCKWPRACAPSESWVSLQDGVWVRYNTVQQVSRIVAREISHDLHRVLPCSELTSASSELVNHARACGRSRTSSALTFCASITRGGTP